MASPPRWLVCQVSGAHYVSEERLNKSLNIATPCRMRAVPAIQMTYLFARAGAHQATTLRGAIGQARTCGYAQLLSILYSLFWSTLVNKFDKRDIGSGGLRSL